MVQIIIWLVCPVMRSIIHPFSYKMQQRSIDIFHYATLYNKDLCTLCLCHYFVDNILLVCTIRTVLYTAVVVCNNNCKFYYQQLKLWITTYVLTELATVFAHKFDLVAEWSLSCTLLHDSNLHCSCVAS